jgi:glycosyltransferase involved in cell wall biosynthesis
VKILYPYNEILPKRSAHDVYVARNCAALARAGCEVVVLCGAGSDCPADLAAHYEMGDVERLRWQTLPILRKNFGLPFSWNALFFWGSQRQIRRVRPDWVALSVRKQGAYHLKRKVPGVKYVYEVHELAWYPGRDLQDPKLRRRLEMERLMLSRADAVTVTTGALRDILQGAPYHLKVPIQVVPLAVDFEPLPAPEPLSGELHLMYVGQMYQGQGVELLLKALARTSRIRLTLVGGKPEELAALRQLALSLGVEQRVHFAGFRAPSALPALAAGAQALVAPFSASGRMPYVAHTKLLEYAAWQRPVLAPDLPVTREHFEETGGWIPFQADDIGSLAQAMQTLREADKWQALCQACRRHSVATWADRSRSYLAFLCSV